MSKPSSDDSAKKSTGSATAAATAHANAHDPSRESIESIVFAFVLALLFRTFVAEAFVIPTGSMAPTLFGRNKDVVCTKCQYKYQVGASAEVDKDGYLLSRIEQSTCPNCRHVDRIRDLPVFKGDRILVNKFPYQLGEPDRWDVIVFRYPEDPQLNYIKRLVGLPGETLKISRGDVYARKGSEGDFEILRKKDPNKQKALQQLVFDDRHVPKDEGGGEFRERWTPMTRIAGIAALDGWTEDAGSWQQDRKARHFSIPASDQLKWVRYRHLVPNRDEWGMLGQQEQAGRKPQLITDFCGYNTFFGPDDDRYWVGDLTLNCTVEITSVSGESPELVFELVEGVRRYQCRFDIKTGIATLLRNDDLSADPNAAEVEMAKAQTTVRGPGKYTLTFANVDDRLCLWVNSSWLSSGLVSFGKGAEYAAPENRNPQQGDLSPAGFAVRGMDARVSQLVLERDVYYRAESKSNSGSYEYTELPKDIRIHASLSTPEEYADLYSRNSREATFGTLSSDEFFALGDNSPQSSDSRLWPNGRDAVNRHAVPRPALLGKAFFIYWPHGIPFGIPFVNGGKPINVWNHTVEKHNGRPVVDTYPEYLVPFYPQWWRWQRIR